MTSVSSGSSGSASTRRSSGSSRRAHPSSGRRPAIRARSASGSSHAAWRPRSRARSSSAPTAAAISAAILCTGGFAASPELVTRYVAPAASLRLRANPWSEGDGLATHWPGARPLTPGMDEFYGRNMPDASWDETGARVARPAVRTLRADLRRGRDRVLLGRRRLVVGDERRPGDGAPPAARGRTTCSTRRALEQRVRDRTVAQLVEAAPAESRVAARRSAVRSAGRHGGGGARGRLDHPHDRRAARRRAGAGPAGRTARRSTGCGRRASTRAACRRAATRAALPRRSCSGLAAAEDAAR